MDGDGKMGDNEVGPAPAGGDAGADVADRITFVNLESPHPDMERRLRDAGFCDLLMDAKESGGEVSLIGRDVFRVEEQRPYVDEIHMPDGNVPPDLVQEED